VIPPENTCQVLDGHQGRTTDGMKPTRNAATLRTLARLVPFAPISILVRTTSKGAGITWHDHWSRTRVVTTRPTNLRGRHRGGLLPTMGAAAAGAHWSEPTAALSEWITVSAPCTPVSLVLGSWLGVIIHALREPLDPGRLWSWLAALGAFVLVTILGTAPTSFCSTA
jgi:hypothetical protein